MKNLLKYTIILSLSLVVFGCGSPSDCECQQQITDGAVATVTGDFDYNDFDMGDYEDCIEKYLEEVKGEKGEGLDRYIWTTPGGWFSYHCENNQSHGSDDGSAPVEKATPIDEAAQADESDQSYEYVPEEEMYMQREQGDTNIQE